MIKLNDGELAPKRLTEAEALFSSIGNGAISTDEFGKITRVNPVAQRLLGYESSELLGEWYPEKVIAVNRDNKPLNLIDRPITKAILSGQPVAENIYYRRKNGQIFPAALSVAPIISDDRPLGAIEVFRDITVEEEVDRMKSDFISLASHQLRTPLSAIKTYSHMLADGFMGEISSTQRKALHTIIGASNRMNELISTLLNISRIEAGTIAVRPRQLNVQEVVEEVIKELAIAALEKNVTIKIKVTGTAAKTIKTDSLILKEVLVNLLTNSIKYSLDGGNVLIQISCRRDDIQIKVSDSGWGIPKYAQDQIFSKFFRARNIVIRETTGTGLGLYLVKGLVDAIGGRIWFKSEEGQGTHFYVSLPRNQNHKPKPAPTPPKL